MYVWLVVYSGCATHQVVTPAYGHYRLKCTYVGFYLLQVYYIRL